MAIEGLAHAGQSAPSAGVELARPGDAARPAGGREAALESELAVEQSPIAAVSVEPEDVEEDDADLEHDEPQAARPVPAPAPQEPEVEQELPPRVEASAFPTPVVTLAPEAERLMDRGAPFSPEEMQLLHDFVTQVRGASYWITFKNRPDISALRHAEGALRHHQTVQRRK